MPSPSGSGANRKASRTVSGGARLSPTEMIGITETSSRSGRTIGGVRVRTPDPGPRIRGPRVYPQRRTSAAAPARSPSWRFTSLFQVPRRLGRRLVLTVLAAHELEGRPVASVVEVDEGDVVFRKVDAVLTLGVGEDV